MKFRTIGITAVLLSFGLAASCTHSESTPAASVEAPSNKEIVSAALDRVLVNTDVSAVDEYFGPTYIQHNPGVPDGVEALKGLVESLSQSGEFEAEYVRIIADGDLVASHGRYVGFGPKPLVAFDIFRLEDGKIVEHWDNLIEEQGSNPSGHTQLDGATEITDIDETEANKATVVDFITRSLINGEQVDITQYISPVTYTQHNPQVGDGLEGFGAFMQQIASQGIMMKYDKIHLVVGEGNFVLTASEGSFGGQPTAYYDLFRLEEGLIVEHWDVITDMPGDDAEHNESGKF